MARKRPTAEPAPEPAANLAGLVQACKDDPDDDGLRLILADYLEDHGEPDRAELIRLGVAVAGVEPASVAALHARLARLRRDHDGRWLAGLGGKGVRAGFARGFVTVEGTAASLRDGLADVGPWAERLTLGGVRATVAAFLNAPSAATFSAVRLGLNLDPTVAAVLAGPAVGPRLREIAFPLPADRDEATRPLFAPDAALGRLRRLAINGVLSLPALRALAGASFATGLHSLATTMRLERDQAAVLGGAETLAGLAELDLGIDPLAVATLADSPHLRPRVLRLSGWGPGNEALVALARSPLLARVRALRLTGFTLTERGLGALAASPALAGVEDLELANCRIDDAGVRALAASDHLANLRRLNLAGNRIGSSGAAALANAPALGGLERLVIDHNPLGPTGPATLFRGKRLAALRDLSAANIGADDPAVEALIAGPLAPRLRRLRLGDALLRPASIVRLAAAPSLAALEALELVHRTVTNRCMTALAASVTLERLVWLTVSIPAGAAEGLAALTGLDGLPRLVFLGLALQDTTNPPSTGVVRMLAESPRRGDGFVPFCPYAHLLPPAWTAVLSPEPTG